jgi:iron complex outermembrane recepter protein
MFAILSLWFKPNAFIYIQDATWTGPGRLEGEAESGPAAAAAVGFAPQSKFIEGAVMNSSHFKKAYVLAVTGTTLIAVSAVAHAAADNATAADESPAASPDTSGAESSGLQEIVVTAQRKTESLSKTPVAVSVVGADTLAQAQIVTEQDLQAAVPGLQVRGTINSEQLNYTLRGQSVDAFSGARPGVLPYVNEVQIGGSGTSSAFYDLQSVQVLKGPQGILFGRSATGGAVLFTTQKPTDTFGGYGQVTGGNYGTGQFEGALNMPLIDERVLLRIAGIYQRHDGYQFNIYDDRHVGQANREGGRVSLTVNFNDQLHDDLVVDFLHSEGESTEGVISGLTTKPGSYFVPVSVLYGGTATPAATAAGVATLNGFLPFLTPAQAAAQYAAYFADPRHPADGIAGALAAQQARGPYTIDTDGANGFQNNNGVLTNATTYSLNDSTRIKNIVGYTHLNSILSNDTDGSPYEVGQASPPGHNETRQTSEEVQLLGTALGNRLDYVSGFYYSSERFHYESQSASFDILGPFASIGSQDFVLDNTTYAGYGHVTYQLTDSGLAANAGARYTSEKVEYTNVPDDSNHSACTVPGQDCQQSKTYDKLSWQFGLQEQLNPDLLVYAVSRRAFKSGGFNGFALPLLGSASTAGNGYGAEQVTDAEIGAKFKGDVWGIPVRLNTAFFHDWTEDSQRTAYTLINFEPSTVTVNVPHGTVNGVELDGQIKPVEWLNLGVAGTYTSANFSGTSPGAASLAGCRGATVVANALPTCFDQVPDLPRYTGTFFGEIALPVTASLVATLHGDVYYQTQSTTSTVSSNSTGTVMPAYAIGNFYVGMSGDKNKWSVTANIKNAFNRTYYIGGIPSGSIYQVNTLIPGQPRTYSLTARMEF